MDLCEPTLFGQFLQSKQNGEFYEIICPCFSLGSWIILFVIGL